MQLKTTTPTEMLIVDRYCWLSSPIHPEMSIMYYKTSRILLTTSCCFNLESTFYGNDGSTDCSHVTRLTLVGGSAKVPGFSALYEPYSKGPTSVFYVFPPSGSPFARHAGLFDPTTCTMPSTAYCYCNHSDSLVPLLKEHHEI
jgi:hypothetical protein